MKSTFIVTKPFDHAGRKFSPGDHIKLNDADAAFMVRYGPDKDSVRPITPAERAADRVEALMRKRLAAKLVAEALVTPRTIGGFAQAAITHAKTIGSYYGSRKVDGSAESPPLPVSVKATMGETAGATGGYLVSQEMAAPILLEVCDLNFFRRGALVLPMASAELVIPALNVTSTPSAGQSAFAGGLAMTFVGENVTRTETEPTVNAISLKAWECGGYLQLSTQLVQDSAALGAYLQRGIPHAIAYAELKAFLVGTGIGQPLGVLNSPASISISRQTGGTITYQDASSMLASLPPSSIESASWVCSPTTLPKLLQLTDGTFRAVSLRAGVTDTPSRPRMSLLGLPLRVVEPLPALGTKGDLMLIDPSFYIIGDRNSLELASSQSPGFLQFQTSLRVIRRLDGQPAIGGPITLQDGTTQVSPFVVLN